MYSSDLFNPAGVGVADHRAGGENKPVVGNKEAGPHTMAGRAREVVIRRLPVGVNLDDGLPGVVENGLNVAINAFECVRAFPVDNGQTEDEPDQQARNQRGLHSSRA